MGMTQGLAQRSFGDEISLCREAVEKQRGRNLSSFLVCSGLIQRENDQYLQFSGWKCGGEGLQFGTEGNLDGMVREDVRTLGGSGDLFNH